MPVVTFHLVEGHCSAEQKVRLLQGASRLYSQVLRAPLERVRALISLHAPDEFAVAGEVNGLPAPFFEFIVLEGRPLDERQALLSGFTELLVETLAVERSGVRGRCIRVEAQDWSIGGQSAALLREQEIRARAASSGSAA
ncbi:tautomerase family protein [Pseudomonas sp. N040]|uniref:tautomerase family protein n=1 Tax=Pseudomonas sp. N040 TaxID=2785325 RepID=UPI0018A31E3D|nr:tautomerase family protein [Pseudomonas sp. N040]MBF7729120.1 tautomerase family protein [Pseudomonas sp. N040]MBW7012760.1 tautomerase family protein [Pseudomonas sp. N040]